MPIRKRNADGSLSYTQTADEKLQNQSQQNVKQLMRNMKKMNERLDTLEASVRRLTESLDTVNKTLEANNQTDKKVVYAIL